MGCVAVPDEQTVLELVPLVYEHTTDCEAQVIDGRVYIIWTDRRPEGLVAVAKTVCPAGALDALIERLQMARAVRDATIRSRGN